jgi:hypothetical protein
LGDFEELIMQAVFTVLADISLLSLVASVTIVPLMYAWGRTATPVAPTPEPVIEPTPEPVIEPVIAPAPVEWAALTPQQLRRACQGSGIKWRNAHGPNKHLSKREMVAALNAGLPLAQVA